MVFALHPVHVQAVAWISQLPNLMATLLCLSSVLAYLRFCQIEPPVPEDGGIGPPPPHRGVAYAVSLVLFICALLCHPVSAALPIVLALLLWWQRRAGWRLGIAGWSHLPPPAASLPPPADDSLLRGDLLRMVPFAVLAAAGAVMTFWSRQVNAAGIERDCAGFCVGSCSDRCPRDLVLHRTLLWPVPLLFGYPSWPTRGVQVWLYPIAVAMALAALWRQRRRWGAGPWIAVLIFIVLLAAAMATVRPEWMRYSSAADHLQYPASIAMISLLVALLIRLLERQGDIRHFSPAGLEHQRPRESRRAGIEYPRPRVLRLIVGVALPLVLLWLTWRQSSLYRDEPTLWQATLATRSGVTRGPQPAGRAVPGGGPAAPRGRPFPPTHGAGFQRRAGPRRDLGQALEAMGQVDEAIQQYTQALVQAEGRRPKAEVAYSLRAELHRHLAEAYAKRGNVREAYRHYTQALELDPRDEAATTTSGFFSRNRTTCPRRSGIFARHWRSTRVPWRRG